MPNRVEGRVCIVTGAAQGLGATYAKALAAEGGRIVVSDIDDASGVAAEITAAGGEAIALQNDVADWESCRDMVAKSREAFGRVDVLVNISRPAGFSPACRSTCITMRPRARCSA